MKRFLFEDVEDLKNIDPEDLDLTDEELVEYLKANKDVAEEFLKTIKDSDKISNDKKKEIIKNIKEISDKLNEDLVITESLVVAAIVAGVSIGAAHEAIHWNYLHTQSNYLKAIKNEEDPEKKKELEKELDTYRKVRQGKNKILLSKKSINQNIEKLKKRGKIPEEYNYDTMKNQEKMIRAKVKAAGENSKEKEEVVKDKDGSEIIARAKKNGDGKTFVRKKNGKEIGYATKDEFQAAKKKANESIDRDLRNYIYECLEK